MAGTAWRALRICRWCGFRRLGRAGFGVIFKVCGIPAAAGQLKAGRRQFFTEGSLPALWAGINGRRRDFAHEFLLMATGAAFKIVNRHGGT